MSRLWCHPRVAPRISDGNRQYQERRLWEVRPTNPEYLNRCGRCFLKGLCEQCPAKSWMEHGTLDTPVEYLCAVAHAQARYLGLLNEKESAWEVEDGKKRVQRFSGSTVQRFEDLGGSTVHGSGV